MNEALPNVGTDELHAFVDGQLEPDRVAAVLAWLQAHPEDAARVAHWQAQRRQLRAAARGLEIGESPAVLGAVVQRAADRTRRRAAWRQAAAAVLLLGVGVGSGVVGARLWDARGAVSGGAPELAASPGFVREAQAAHAVFTPETRHPVEVAASDEAHLVQWLGRRLGTPLKAPQLGEQGFRLLGGRLLAGEGAPRAQFMYEDGQGRRLTLYVAAFRPGQAPAETAFRSLRDGPRESFYWVEGAFGYALSAELPSAEMQALARAVYGQLAR